MLLQIVLLPTLPAILCCIGWILRAGTSKPKSHQPPTNKTNKQLACGANTAAAMVGGLLGGLVIPVLIIIVFILSCIIKRTKGKTFNQLLATEANLPETSIFSSSSIIITCPPYCDDLRIASCCVASQ